MPLRKFTEQDSIKAKALRLEGLTYAAIGRAMGISEQHARWLALRKPKEAVVKPVRQKEEGMLSIEREDLFKHDKYYFF